MGQDPEELRAQIARTREELGQDLDQLADKVSPAKVVERRVDATKDKVLGMKEKIMGSTSSGTSSMSGATGAVGDRAGALSDKAGDAAQSLSATGHSAVDSVSTAAQQAPAQVKQRAAGNPLAAGVIAFGVGWLASALLPASKVEQEGAVKLKQAAQSVAEPVKQGLTQAATEVKDNLTPALSDAADSVKATATDAVGTVKEQAADAKDTVADQAKGSAGTVKDTAVSAAQDAKQTVTTDEAPVDTATYVVPAEPVTVVTAPPATSGPRSGHPELDERLDAL